MSEPSFQSGHVAERVAAAGVISQFNPVGFSEDGVRPARITFMSDYTERLWEDLHDLLLGLDSKFSGPEEAAVGCYGGRLVRTIYQTELLRGNEGLSVYWELLWAGFESLVSDYRISDNELMGMRFAYSQLRRDASASNDPRTSRGGKSDSLH